MISNLDHRADGNTCFHLPERFAMEVPYLHADADKTRYWGEQLSKVAAATPRKIAVKAV